MRGCFVLDGNLQSMNAKGKDGCQGRNQKHNSCQDVMLCICVNHSLKQKIAFRNLIFFGGGGREIGREIVNDFTVVGFMQLCEYFILLFVATGLGGQKLSLNTAGNLLQRLLELLKGCSGCIRKELSVVSRSTS